MDFYDTVGGRRFVEWTVPKLIHAIERAAKAMEHANRLKQREVDILAREFNPGAPAAEIKPSDGQVPELSDGQELGGDGEAYVVDGRR